ncbi:MAG: bifunctional 3,4-dihydroxy-2-butanone 4-phosphate synthase/GTP cyclohydrolase II [Caldithrix sp. RBG_13_44_9]|nr:MAG: bifunctional 3,4-dihydroxy-2-butanone 4-phosphate synthase/GTP cyclohydrolase II [Caldithrix sp. RBG_13_44_9]
MVKSVFSDIEAALEDLQQGKILIVVDDEDRENEGDFIMAAEKVTTEAINFMTKFGRGIVCLALTEKRAEELELEYMVNYNTALHGTAFTVTIDACSGTTTGVSAHDRALTIKKAIHPDTKPAELARPGHIFPLISKPGGVLRRAGHTEAVIDLTQMAGLNPSGVLCEILDEDGQMARVPGLQKIAQEHQLRMITIADLIKYRRRKEKLVERKTEVNLPTTYGDFRLILYENALDPRDHHLALVKGDIANDQPVLVRVHSECLTGDTLGSMRCDCGDQLHHALQQIEKEGRGALLYMRQEGRGIGLPNKILAYKLQDEGKDTVEANEMLGFKADLRDYGLGAQMLLDLGIKKIRLMTNNPKKVVGLQGYGLEIVERVAIQMSSNPSNEGYLKTKQEKLGHLLLFDKKPNP